MEYLKNQLLISLSKSKIDMVDEMIKICKILESIDENIMIKQKMLSKNKFLKSALRNDLLLGRKRVKV